MRQTSITFSPPSLLTPKPTTDSTIPLTAKTLTKRTQLDFVEVMLTQMFAVVASITLRRSLLKQLCPNQKEAIGWYDWCMLRYSNRSIFGIEETDPNFAWSNKNGVSAGYVNQFNDDLRTLLESLRSQAVAGGSLRKYFVTYRKCNCTRV